MQTLQAHAKYFYMYMRICDSYSILQYSRQLQWWSQWSVKLLLCLGAEVRSVVTKYPKIIVYEKRAIQVRIGFLITFLLYFSQ